MENCIYCNSNNIYKFGKYKNKQQYKCKKCNKIFTKNSNPNRGLIINDEKYCNACEKFKPLSEFLFSEGKPRSRCKVCFLEKNNSRYRTYKLNEELFNKMLYNQNNQCAICHNEFKLNKKTFIDHNHTTGKVRGLLCPKCNILLGNCNDDIEILKSAITYLIKD